MNISIFGLGYVGCVSLGCLAKNGHTVVGVDKVAHKVKLINEGKPTIIEKGVDELIRCQHKAGRISATKDYEAAVLNTDLSIICVGTPSTSNGHLNLDYIYKVAAEIGASIRKKNSFHVIAIRSTVLPGTNRKVGAILEEASGTKRNEQFAVVSNPEFLREGSALHDYYHPAVTVLGGDHQGALRVMSKIYADVEAPIEQVDIEVAELIKYVNNAFHALKISFANEVGNVCKKLDIDSHQVMDLFCKDTHLNISPAYLKPGFAYGGSCLPKDLKALKTIAHDHYLNAPILHAIEESNTVQKQLAYEMVLEAGRRNVAILGLSFKAGTDDLRHSPIVEVTERLLGKGFSIRIYDKNVNLSKISGTNKAYIDAHIPHLSDLISNDLEEVVGPSDVIVVNQRNKSFEQILAKYPDKKVVDLVKVELASANGNYQGICW
ncbi:MAG: nucleotide sugar dehydrogenase [Bacteroidetes bacterium]|jgi:GDP-mannose 6-dehydrogenase|nr:nucleotide sugar dehydrogenase [Bacteroidota bacterium]